MKKICVVTGSRAEYGLLRPLIRRIQESAGSELSLVVTGSHLDESFGLTKNEIITDGFPINAEIRIPTDITEKKDMGNATGKAIEAFSEYFFANRPDILVILGDRYEIFGVTFAAAIQGIPVAHIHGGEVTEGAVDDFLRHSITKMSWLHFTSCEEYRRRVIQLGEDPKRVFNVGALGVENCLSLDLLSEEEIREDLALGDDNYAVVTFHPATLDMTSAEKQVRELICAMDAYPDLRYVITLSNADAGGDEINRIWKSEGEKRENWEVVASLGVVRYLSALKYAKLMLGNSSSGIIEGPAIRIPTVNVGDRQRGRITADSVITCAVEETEIRESIRRALSPDFQAFAKNTHNPYGNGKTSELILRIISDTLDDGISDIKKSFHDVKGKSFSQAVHDQLSRIEKDFTEALDADDHDSALAIMQLLGKQNKTVHASFVDKAKRLRYQVLEKNENEKYRESLLEIFNVLTPEDFDYEAFTEVNQLRFPIMQASSLRQQFVRRRRMKQLGLVPDRWLVISKQLGFRFADMLGLKHAYTEFGHSLDSLRSLTCRKDIVVKPNISHDSIGAFIVYDENNILTVETQKKLASWEEMIKSIETQLASGRISGDSFAVQTAIYGNSEKKTPPHDLRFYTFYGEIPFVTETVHIPEEEKLTGNYTKDYYQWFWDEDGNQIGFVKEKPPEWIEPQKPTKEMWEEARNISLRIPAPYFRLDFLLGDNELYFDEFCSMTGQGIVIPELEFPNWNRSLGSMYLKAEMRLMNDLLNGKRFDEIVEFNRQIDDEWNAGLLRRPKK